MRVDEEERAAIPYRLSGRGLRQMGRSLAEKEEAGKRDMNLAEEHAGLLLQIWQRIKLAAA
jgi:hypothetical protein